MTQLSPNSPMGKGSSNIFEQIGGDEAVSAVVDLFYDKVLADPELAHYFTDIGLEGLKDHQRLFIGQALGSTEPYSGRTLADAHAYVSVTDTAFDLVIEHLGAALAEAGVDEDTIGTIATSLSPLRKDIVTA
ncbi:group I truncated hemoglobin [Streptomyces endophyticus]|uniref:Group 1 truncated hemoglobin n=1 Tax=Streptomyces endophyticus TaxID=714166 RepID=A0ABU6FDR9_9ACTN|nr:group 1 truncated hemoglobin [Streptomyces endophyticus]MEB8342189.1 group 1 truncated hemoglobin [Streptomyces endophyticus]